MWVRVCMYRVTNKVCDFRDDCNQFFSEFFQPCSYKLGPIYAKSLKTYLSRINKVSSFVDAIVCLLLLPGQTFTHTEG